jgi:hypothetical protein
VLYAGLIITWQPKIMCWQAQVYNLLDDYAAGVGSREEYPKGETG